MGRDHNNLWWRETDNSLPNAKQWAIQNQESCPWDIYWCMQTTARISFTRHPPYGCKSTKNNEKEILQCTLFCSWEHRHRNLTLHFSCYIIQKDNWMQCSFTITLNSRKMYFEHIIVSMMALGLVFGMNQTLSPATSRDSMFHWKSIFNYYET